jgi:hypothetical protein
VQAVFDLLADRPSAVNLAVHGLIHRLTHLIGGLGRIVSPFSITKRQFSVYQGPRTPGAAAHGAKRSFNKSRCSRQVSFVRIWKLEVAPDYHRVSGVVNRRRHRPLRAILPDRPGSAGAIVGQRERAATITR